MKYFLSFILLLTLSGSYAQSGFIFGFGYSGANIKAPRFNDFLKSANQVNTGLTKPFNTDQFHQGYNIWIGSKSQKSTTVLDFHQLTNKITGEGVVNSISSDPGKFEISTRHSSVSFVYDRYLLSFFAVGFQIGYSYSTVRNRQYELAFGESKSVVDKKGGIQPGLNAIIQIPLGKSAFIQLQPYYEFALYKQDMDNIAFMYLGADNTAATKSSLKGMGMHIRLGFEVQ